MDLEIHLVISKQALERIKKDKFVKQNRKWYERQILLIKSSYSDRPTERIGDFNVSPRGREVRRIAWHFDIENNILRIFIDDLLYHINSEDYVEKWNTKVRRKEITKNKYGPYLFFEGL